MYKNIKGLLNLAEQKGVNLSDIILENEIMHTDIPAQVILESLRNRYEVMKASASKAMEMPTEAEGSFICGLSKLQNDYRKSEKTICGDFINKTMARALSSSEVNAAMGKICAMPTAGSCGIVPAVIVSVAEKLNSSEEEIMKALLTASGLGAIVTENATVAGAEGGCQAECGVAAAMAAAAAVELCGGTPKEAVSAFSISIMNIMGLVCDPVGGLVQIPCAHRNASQAANALISADMAMAGIPSFIDADDIVDAMYKVGRMLPTALRETALGGVAATESGHALIEKGKA